MVGLFLFNNLAEAIPDPSLLLLVRLDRLLLVSLNCLLLVIILVPHLEAIAEIELSAVSRKIAQFKPCNVSCVLSVTDLVYLVYIRWIPCLLSLLRCRCSDRRMMLHIFRALFISSVLKVLLGLKRLSLFWGSIVVWIVQIRKGTWHLFILLKVWRYCTISLCHLELILSTNLH